jgi:hypothetical protein
MKKNRKAVGAVLFIVLIGLFVIQSHADLHFKYYCYEVVNCTGQAKCEEGIDRKIDCSFVYCIGGGAIHCLFDP